MKTIIPLRPFIKNYFSITKSHSFIIKTSFNYNAKLLIVVQEKQIDMLGLPQDIRMVSLRQSLCVNAELAFA
ncbi:MAG: hypothetical protein V2A54_04005 [Bacteroidota bacterium]